MKASVEGVNATVFVSHLETKDDILETKDNILTAGQEL